MDPLVNGKLAAVPEGFGTTSKVAFIGTYARVENLVFSQTLLRCDFFAALFALVPDSEVRNFDVARQVA